MSQTVFAAMSGGVDSSVAALLLLEQGWHVVGVTLRLYESCGGALKTCCSLEDALDAKAVAARLGIEHRILDGQTVFETQVIGPFVEDYARGRTPNPCILCNERVKFGTLWDYARAQGADAVATGHYARLVPDGEEVALRRAVDASKDQSYVLFPMTLEQRRRTLFPLGGLSKEQVRAKAREAGLPTADKRESQDLCFVPDGDYSAFVEKRMAVVHPGQVRHVDGRVLGAHQGIHHFTVGQRKGLGIPFAEPLYVVALDAATHEVLVGPKSSLGVGRFRAERWHWHIPPEGCPPVVEVQTRYHQPSRRARLLEGAEGVVIEYMDRPESVTPGQAAVAYREDAVVGGGWIVGGEV